MREPEELHWSELAVTDCSACGKRSYVSRKAARRIARALYPGQALRAYQCGDYWHIGHTPTAVRRGERGAER